ADGTVTNDTTPEVTGVAEPGATVDVLIDGVVVATTAVDDAGNWIVTPGALAEGAHVLAARARDAAGNESGLSAATHLTVDTTAPAPPVFTAPPATTGEVHPIAAGTAEPGATVDVYVDGQLAGTATAGSDGAWSFQLPALS